MDQVSLHHMGTILPRVGCRDRTKTDMKLKKQKVDYRWQKQIVLEWVKQLQEQLQEEQMNIVMEPYSCPRKALIRILELNAKVKFLRIGLAHIKDFKPCKKISILKY